MAKETLTREAETIVSSACEAFDDAANAACGARSPGAVRATAIGRGNGHLGCRTSPES